MNTQNSQHHKRQEQNNTEWLDALINKIGNMKNKISESAWFLKILGKKNLFLGVVDWESQLVR